MVGPRQKRPETWPLIPILTLLRDLTQDKAHISQPIPQHPQLLLLTSRPHHTGNYRQPHLNSLKYVQILLLAR